MPGKAMIILLLGMIIITGLMLTGIFRSSNNISKNMVSDYQRRATYNIAQSGANMGLRKLVDDYNYRNNVEAIYDMMGGKVSMTVIDTTFAGIPVIAVKSTGFSNYGTNDQISYTSFAVVPKDSVPDWTRGAFTSNSGVDCNGNDTVDGRDHNLDGSLVSPGGVGTYAIWSQGTVTPSGNASIGGTVSGIDYAPTKPAPAGVIIQNTPLPGGYPISPDQALEYPEGTLQALADKGVFGSQHVIISDPNTVPPLRYPLSGVTLVDFAVEPKNGFSMNGSGILILNNISASPLAAKLLTETFVGIVILSNHVNIDKLHGNVIGCILTTAKEPTGNVALNGTGNVLYSSEAIKKAIFRASLGKVVWFEKKNLF